MKLVVDTNILLSALIKDSLTRKILLHPKFEFYVPEHVFHEIELMKDEIIRRSRINENEFYIVLSTISTNIITTPKTDFTSYIPKARKIIGSIDPNDVPFIALALSFDNDGIWTNDKHFLRQKVVKVWRTEDLIKKL